MKIFKIKVHTGNVPSNNLVEENEMSVENINGKVYVEENYLLSDIGSGVISKGQAIRHYEKIHPEHVVVSISSFKVDHQDETISIRVLVKPKVIGLKEFSKAVMDMHAAVGNVDRPPIGQKLLNPGYDELKALYDALIIAHEETKAELEVTRIAALAPCEKCEELEAEVNKTGLALLDAVKEIDYTPDDDTPDERARRRESEDEDGPFSESAPTAEEVAAAAIEVLEDAADLADAKEAMKDDDSVPLSEIDGDSNE